MTMKEIEVINAFGHRNIQSTHKTTLEITREENLTKRGDCIVAVKATKGAADLNPRFKDVARSDVARITIIIKAGEVSEAIRAWGSGKLTFTHPHDLVVRKSSYVCGRTLAIKADKAAADLDRRLVERLKDPRQMVEITIVAERSDL